MIRVLAALLLASLISSEARADACRYQIRVDPWSEGEHIVTRPMAVRSWLSIGKPAWTGSPMVGPPSREHRVRLAGVRSIAERTGEELVLVLRTKVKDGVVAAADGSVLHLMLLGGGHVELPFEGHVQKRIATRNGATKHLLWPFRVDAAAVEELRARRVVGLRLDAALGGFDLKVRGKRRRAAIPKLLWCAR